MAAELTHFDPFKMSLPDDLVVQDPRTGEKTIDLSTMPSAAAVEAAQTAADAAQTTADDAEAASKIVRFAVTIPDIVTPGYVYSPVPGAGTWLSFKIATISIDGEVAVAASAGGIAIVKATLPDGSNPGVVASATLPPNQTYGANDSLEIEVITDNTIAGACVVMVTYELD